MPRSSRRRGTLIRENPPNRRLLQNLAHPSILRSVWLVTTMTRRPEGGTIRARGLIGSKRRLGCVPLLYLKEGRERCDDVDAVLTLDIRPYAGRLAGLSVGPRRGKGLYARQSVCSLHKLRILVGLDRGGRPVARCRASGDAVQIGILARH